MYRALLTSILGVLLLSAYSSIYSSLVISEVLPNTIDDANLEFIRVSNAGCAEIFLTSYTLSDLVKTYTITWGSILPWETRVFLRPETKIALNNDTETITLTDASSTLLSSLSWTWTTKWQPISQRFTLESCTPAETNTGMTSTGSTATNSGSTEVSWSGSGTWTGETWDDGAVVESGSGLTNTWTLETGTGTETTLTWGVSHTGTTSTGAVPPIPVNCAPSIGSITPWMTSAVFMGFFSPCGDLMIELTNTEEYFSWTLNDWLLNFSELAEDTDYSYRIASLSSTFSESTMGTFTTTASALTPLTLSYRDSDTNGKIDTISLMYPRTVTGVLDLSKVLIYSQSWGLASGKIDTESGIVSAYSFSGSELLLTLHEQDGEKSLLQINNSTISDLRIKSLSGWWLTDAKWREADLLTLTTMLDGYAPARIMHPELVPESTTDSGTTTVEESQTLSGMAIFLALQSPTNATYDDTSKTFTCSGELETCRVNPTFEESFTGAFTKSLIAFEYTTGSVFSRHPDGNPNTLYFERGTGSLRVQFVEKASSGVLTEQTYNVIYHHQTIISGGGGSSAPPPMSVSKYPIWDVRAKVRLQSFTPSRYRYIDWADGIETLHCVGREYCRVNLTAEDSTVPESSNRHLLWTMPDGKPDFRENLPEFLYSAGVYDFQLVVSDGGVFDRKYFRVIVRPSVPPRIEAHPTPATREKLENSTVPITSHPKVLISQIMANPSGSDEQEWLELTALKWGSLSGCILSSGNRKHQFTTEEILTWDARKISWTDANISLGNQRWSVQITCSEQIIDRVSWSGSVRNNVLLTFSGAERHAVYGEYIGGITGKQKVWLENSKKVKALPYVSFTENPVSFSLQTSGTKNITLRDRRITCSTRASTCKINLTAHGPKGVIYLWSTNGIDWIEKKDPRAFILNHGVHTISLRAFAPTSGDVYEVALSARVIRPTTQTRKSVTKKAVGGVAKEETTIVSLQKNPLPEEKPVLPPMTEWLLFTLTAILGIVGVFTFFQRKKQ